MYRIRLCRVVLGPRPCLFDVQHLSQKSLIINQSAKCFSTTRIRRGIDPDSIKFENVTPIVANTVGEPSLYSQGLGLANHWPSGYMQVSTLSGAPTPTYRDIGKCSRHVLVNS